MSSYIDILDADVPSLIKACVYGNSGEGKSALGTALPWGHERFGEKAILVCADEGSESFDSVAPEDRPHLIRVKMQPKYNEQKKKWEFDPHAAAMEAASRYYSNEFEGVKTIIWDGGSETADKMLRGYANSGINVNRSTGQDPHLVVGTKGDASYMAMPMQADYGYAQQGILNLLGHLFNQPLNVIFICQADIYTPENGVGEQIGGPATAGGKAINKVLSKFNTVIRVASKSEKIVVDGKRSRKMVYKAYTEKRGIWAAKLRKPPGVENPVAEVDITGNPRKFWDEMLAFYDGLSAEGVKP